MQQLKNYLENSDDLGMADDVDSAIDLVKKETAIINKTTTAKIQGIKAAPKKDEE